MTSPAASSNVKASLAAFLQNQNGSSTVSQPKIYFAVSNNNNNSNASETSGSTTVYRVAGDPGIQNAVDTNAKQRTNSLPNGLGHVRLVVAQFSLLSSFCLSSPLVQFYVFLPLQDQFSAKFRELDHGFCQAAYYKDHHGSTVHVCQAAT